MNCISEKPRTLAPDIVSDFLRSHRLPDEFRTLITDHYFPLASWVFEHCASNKPMLLGINGAQGTGKSTLADFLKIALETQRGWRVAVLSIDDFYLTQAERAALGDQVHPLLRNRGVPGTHDTAMLSRHVDDLRSLAEGEERRLPRFDRRVKRRQHRRTLHRVRSAEQVPSDLQASEVKHSS